MFIDDEQTCATIPCVVFANKCDVGKDEWEVSIPEARWSLSRRGITLFEVSAKTGQNVEEGFRFVATRFLAQGRKPRVPRVAVPSVEERCSCC
jgi:hypothetical protein